MEKKGRCEVTSGSKSPSPPSKVSSRGVKAKGWGTKRSLSDDEKA